MTSRSLWNYYRDEVNDNQNKNENNFRINNNKTTTSNFFQYNTKITGKTLDNGSRLDTEVVVPLKYLSNFLRSLDLPLINCEVELDLRWRKECIISEISRTSRLDGNPLVWEVATSTAGARFQINNGKLYVSVVTLSINDNIKLLENIKQRFKNIISRNKATKN